MTAALRLLAALAVTLVIAAGLAEVALRVVRHRNDFFKTILYSPADPLPDAGIDSVDALLRVAPFHPHPFEVWFGYKLNSRGFRTAEYTRAKPPGVYRIVALGDSFVSDSGGVPVDQLWHTLVGDRLRQATGEPVEVINLGVPGIGPRFALRLFELEGRTLSPDLVLLGLFVGNDFTDERAPFPFASRLEEHSLLWRLVKHLVTLARNAVEVSEESHRLRFGAPDTPPTSPGGYPLPDYHYDADAALVGEDEFVRIETARLVLFAADRRRLAEEWVADVAHTVTALDQSVRASGGRLVVVIIPDVMQVDESVRQTVLARGAAAPYDFNWVQPAIVRQLTDAGVTALDLMPAFRAAPSRPRLYRLRDTHWSAAGNALAAKQIGAFLAPEQKLPR